MSAEEFLPPGKRDLPKLRRAARACEGCPLYRKATQTVFGEGRADAALALVGEQPGNDEDLVGRPFVGPSGKLLARALAEAGIDRKAAYVTNAVKHFKFQELRGRRLHQKPLTREIVACFPWLREELALVAPRVLVLLGATAARAVIGRPVRLADVRGRFFATDACAATLVTNHPSAILRVPDPDAREKAYAAWLADLRKVARKLRG